MPLQGLPPAISAPNSKKGTLFASPWTLMKFGSHQINSKRGRYFGYETADELKGLSDDSFDEGMMTEIFTFLLKSGEAKTLVTIARAIRSSENQTAHSLKGLLERGRVFYIPSGGGRWGLSKSIK